MSDKKLATESTLDRDTGGQPTLRFERHYDHGVERVWQALTDNDEMSAWFACQVRFEDVAAESKVELTFPGGEPDEGKVLEAEAPHVLAFTWQDEVLRFVLSAEGDGSRLVFTTSVQDPDHIPYSAAGYYLCMEAGLHNLLNGSAGKPTHSAEDLPSFDDLVQDYTRKWKLNH